jgi:tetratricopeptide (TPR) repeat protein
MESAPNPTSPNGPTQAQETTPAVPVVTESSDPLELLNSGLEKLKSDEIEESIELLSKALKAACQNYGDLDEQAAVFYYHYGDALLLQFENSKADNLFGTAVPQEIVYSDDEQLPEATEEAKSDQVLLIQDSEEPQDVQRPTNCDASSSEEEQPESQGEGGLPEGQGEDQQPSDEPDAVQELPSDEPELEEGDLQLCWEALETCRVILERTNSNRELLYKVHLRIGDRQTWNELLEEAKLEYVKALEILGEIEGVRATRRRAEIYFLLGNNSLCRVGHEAAAAEFFNQALEVLKELHSQAGTGEAGEFESLISEIILKRDEAFEQQRSFQVIRESQPGPEAEGLSKPTLTGTITELGVLGKRKRNEEEGDSEYPSKKPKQNL